MNCVQLNFEFNEKYNHLIVIYIKKRELSLELE